MSKSPESDLCNPSAIVWLVDGSRFSDEERAFFVQRLGPSETDRYHGFARSERRRQFLVGRMLLRWAIGRLMAAPPSMIEVEEQAGRAPRLRAPHSDKMQPRFSLSHSGKWVACAVSGDSQLGLDVEVLDPARDLPGISRSVFQANEVAWIEMQPAETRVAAFYQLWSLREALLKLFSNANSGEPIPDLVDAGHAIASHGNGWHSHAFAHPEVSCVLCSSKDFPPSRPLRLGEISHTALLAGLRQVRPRHASDA